MKFYNREKEINWFQNRFATEPNNILLVYGPKSCGKTTLLTKVLSELNLKKYAVNYIDLRGVLIFDFKSFLDVFFPKDATGKILDIVEGITFNLGIFSVKTSDEVLLRQNPFKLMEDKIEAALKRGIRTIIVMDEIQSLKEIYLNGERFLLDELFNLFVRLTKVRNLAHVVLASSDSFFIESVHQNAHLSKTTGYFAMQHLDKTTVVNWLSEESFSKSEISATWKYLGGSPWDIAQVITAKSTGEKVVGTCKDLIQLTRNRMADYMEDHVINQDELAATLGIMAQIVKNGYSDRDEVITPFTSTIIQKFVSQEFWFYDVLKRQILPNSKSCYWATKDLFELRLRQIQ